MNKREDMKQMIERLKQRGVTLTPQRMAVIEFLIKSSNHPCVDTIYQAIKKKYPSISPATVYSTLQLLKEMGEIQELHIRGDRACYDPITWRHHHLLCRSCGRILDVDIDGCPITNNKLIREHRVEEVQAYIYGVCSECLEKERDDKSKS
ncbi:MAG: transcriptional repressor [Candidatus Cloacimonadota bacterium]|nr:MAG: transcriptional repressor [Candidatus Cloacimonadota bacterium]